MWTILNKYFFQWPLKRSKDVAIFEKHGEKAYSFDHKSLYSSIQSNWQAVDA